MTRKKVVVLIPKSILGTPFIQKDIDIMKAQHDVMIISDIPTIKNPFKIIRHIYRNRRNYKTADYIYSWWLTSWYTGLITKLFRKKTIICAGGVDCRCDPDINYGAFCDWKKALIVKFNVRNSHVVLMDASLKSPLETNLGFPLKNYIISNGYFNPDEFKTGNEQRNLILTVSLNKSASMDRHLSKGIDRFIQLALILPEYEFCLAGYTKEALLKLENTIPPNMKIFSYLPLDELKLLYQKTKIYCQFSRHETLSECAVEANLSGCYTIGTNVGGLPKAIGPTGYIHDFNTDPLENLKKKIQWQFSQKYPDLQGREAMIKMFSREKRKKMLHSLIH